MLPPPAPPPAPQMIEHPSNLWAVGFLPNGDLVTACSDHVARIFSSAAERQAPAEVAQASGVVGGACYSAALRASSAKAHRVLQASCPHLHAYCAHPVPSGTYPSPPGSTPTGV